MFRESGPRGSIKYANISLVCVQIYNSSCVLIAFDAGFKSINSSVWVLKCIRAVVTSLISIIHCSRMHLIKKDFLESTFRTFFF